MRCFPLSSSAKGIRGKGGRADSGLPRERAVRMPDNCSCVTKFSMPGLLSDKGLSCECGCSLISPWLIGLQIVDIRQIPG